MGFSGFAISNYAFTVWGPAYFMRVHHLRVDQAGALMGIGSALFGTSGMVEQDDSDTWPHMTLAAKGAQGKKQTLKYQAIYETGAPAGWPGPGIVNEGFTKDDTQWHWWLHWRELMTSES